MKDYDEMAESVLKRRDQYTAKRSRQRKKISSVLSCFCLVALLGMGVWHTGVISEHTAPDAGIGSEQLDGDPSGYNTQESIEKQYDNKGMMPDDLSEIGETDPLDTDIPDSSTDAPVQGEPGSTGALTAYEAVWGGSYMDQNGRWVIWLTENTPENQKKVFQRNPGLLESNTIFKTADYSLAYLTELMAAISEKMGAGKLPHVSSAGLREDMNRVEVTMTTDDADSAAKVFALDTAGGAIEIRYASGNATNEAAVKGPAK